MKININNFFQEIGTVFINPKDIIHKYTDSDEDFIILPKGTYIIADSQQQGYELYDIKNNKNVFFESSWADENTEFETIYISPKESIEFLIESVVKNISVLSSEGWAEGKEYFDLNPFIEKLQVLVNTLNILKNLDK